MIQSFCEHFPMNLSVNVKMWGDDGTEFEKEISAQQMRDSNYQQEQLHTDIEPLPKLKEGELFYLAAAVNVELQKRGVIA